MCLCRYQRLLCLSVYSFDYLGCIPVRFIFLFPYRGSFISLSSLLFSLVILSHSASPLSYRATAAALLKNDAMTQHYLASFCVVKTKTFNFLKKVEKSDVGNSGLLLIKRCEQ